MKLWGGRYGAQAPRHRRSFLLGADLGDGRHGRCHTVMPGAGPASTPGGVETEERRGWWPPRPSPGTGFAHHDVEATGARSAPVRLVPAMTGRAVRAAKSFSGRA